MAVSVPATSGPLAGMIAPVTGQPLGLQRAQVTNGIKEVSNCFYTNCISIIYIIVYYPVIAVNPMQRQRW